MEKRKNNVVKKSISILLLICVLFSCVTCAVNASAVTSNAASSNMISLKLKSNGTNSIKATWSLSGANNKKVLSNKNTHHFYIYYRIKYYVGNTLKTYEAVTERNYNVRSATLKVPHNSLVSVTVSYKRNNSKWNTFVSYTYQRFTLVKAPSVEVLKQTIVNSKAKQAIRYIDLSSYHTVNNKCTIRLEQYIKKTGKYKLLGTYTVNKSNWGKRISLLGNLGAVGTYRTCAVNAHGEKGPYRNFKVLFPPDRVKTINFKYNGYSKSKAAHYGTFSWSAASGAAKYLVNIYNANGYSFVATSTKSRSYTLKVKYGGNFTIRIIPVSIKGEQGAKSTKSIKI